MNKISFTVENVEMLQENPNSNFALLALDFFASGDNLHELYVSEDTLYKTADTIKNCPLVWKYDDVLDDAYTHHPDEVPCGFVPESAVVRGRKLSDGRTMLSTIAYVWKRYTGDLLNIFKRDNNKKPVSVEMSVIETGETEEGKTELLDYKYEGITILGSFVTPAIPLAMANVLSFSEIKEQYENDLKKEFSFEINPGELITFPYKSKSEMNPALKGITPPVSLSQANAIARQAEAIGQDEEKNGWAIAISSFRKTHVVKDGKWIRKKGSTVSASIDVDEESITAEIHNTIKEMAMTQEEKKAEEARLAEEAKIKAEEDAKLAEEEAKKKAEEEAKFAAEEEAKKKAEEEARLAEEAKKEKDFSFSMETMSEFFADEGDEEAKAEIEKGEGGDFGIIMNAIYAKFCNMRDKMSFMMKEQEAYMAENEKLKAFKAKVEEEQMAFAVEKTLNELATKVILPDEARIEMEEKAKEYSLENLDEWINYCKAMSFDFAVKGDPDVEKIGLPFDYKSPKNSNDIWAVE